MNTRKIFLRMAAERCRIGAELYRTRALRASERNERISLLKKCYRFSAVELFYRTRLNNIEYLEKFLRGEMTAEQLNALAEELPIPFCG